MPGRPLRVLTAALVFAVTAHGALAQAGRVGGAALAAPVPVVAPPPAPAPVVRVVPPPAAPMVHSFAPTAAAHVFSPPAVALPQVHAPSAAPQLAPRVTAPLANTHIGSGLCGRTSAVPPTPSVARHYAGIMTSAPLASGHHLRHHRRQEINTGLLWGNSGTCWMWLTRPGHRRLRLHRC